MGWNFLNSALEKLLEELLLLVVSLLWVSLRLLSIIGKKVEEGRPMQLKVFGRVFIELKEENSNLEAELTEKNTSNIMSEKYHIQQVNGKTEVIDESDLQKMDNPISSQDVKVISARDLLAENQQKFLDQEKEVNTNGSSSI